MFIPIGEYSMVVYGSDSKGCILEIYDFEIERGWIPDGRPYTVVIDGVETCDEPDPEDCSNGVDDDGDSYTDCDDSDCYGSEGCDIDNSDPTFIQLPRGGTAKLGDFTGYYLSPSSSPDKSDTLDLEYNVAVPSQVSILIYDSGGSLARTLVDRAIRGAGSNIDNWDGRDDAGEYVPDGVYKIVVSAVNAQKSSEVWDWSGEIVVDNTPPTAAISFIKANDQQFHYYSIIGTASDEQLSAYTLECLDENTYRFLGSEQSPVENGILSWINSAHLDNTSYILKLTVTDRAGNIATDEMPMVIDRTSNGLKIHVNSVVQRMQLATEGYVPAADDINVWIEDGLPPGSTAIETWEWNGNIVYSGMVSHTDPVQEGTHGHYFIHADATIVLGYNENIIQYVYLDPADPPQQILMQFYTDDGNGEYRAYWGSDNIKTGGRSGSASLYRMGELPATGRWIRLKIPAITIDLSGKEVKGIAFVAYDGKAYWDKTAMQPLIINLTFYRRYITKKVQF